MMPLSHIIRKYTLGYKLSKSREKMNHLMYMDDMKLLAKNKKKPGHPNTGSENIQSGSKDGIWHWKMCHAGNKKQETTHDRKNETTKSKKNMNVGEK